MSATPAEIAAAEAAASAKFAAAQAEIARERAAQAGVSGATFGGSVVIGDQHGVSGGVHHGDVNPGHR
ncbi:hypothetical protein [Streptomyces sp. NBC_01361]|uniref:hypothetical protein n=1 Tax=Streptomyces sp. NBC_01361 TaxID=2903838 RepID=UPI002E35C694|nr:hypothetical protein [Streptomyces sp. NBC_01361]